MRNVWRNQILEHLKTSSFQGIDQSLPLPTRATGFNKQTQHLRGEMDDLICLHCGRLKTSSIPSDTQQYGSLPRLTSVSSTGHIDPFDALPVNPTRGSYLLLNHSELIINLYFLPISLPTLGGAKIPFLVKQYHILIKTPTPREGATRDWVPFALANTAILNASFVLAASHWILIGGSQAEVAPAYYHNKVEAIRTINERLADKRSAVSDSILAAIAILAIAEVSIPLQPF
jgi:hypothetical protein